MLAELLALCLYFRQNNKPWQQRRMGGRQVQHDPCKVLHCACASVAFDIRGTPILAAACYCDDCQTAARQLAELPQASAALRADGGTEYLLYRKDRVRCLRGSEFLYDYRLDSQSPTRRVVATCCNSPLFVDFEKGHWFSLYRDRFGADAPALQLRIQTKFKPPGAMLPDDLPTYRSYPLSFIAKLVAARVAMLVSR